MNKKEKIKKINIRNRIWELDFLRGIPLILMVLYHSAVLLVFYSFLFMYADIPESIEWLFRFSDELNEKVIFSSFITEKMMGYVLASIYFVAGISLSLSKNLYKSFIKVLLAALFISVFTYILEYATGIYVYINRGIFHMFAIVYSVNILLNLLVRDKYVRSGVYLALAIFSFVIYSMLVNGKINSTGDSFLASIISFQFSEYPVISGIDVQSLLPWYGFFAIGACISPYLYHKKRSLFPRLNGHWHLPITVIGRNSVKVYFLSLSIFIVLLLIITIIFIPDWTTGFLL